MDDDSMLCHSLFKQLRGAMWRLFPDHQPVSRTRLGFLCALRFILNDEEQEVQIAVDRPKEHGWIVHLSHHYHDARWSMVGLEDFIPVQDYSPAWMEGALRQLVDRDAATMAEVSQ